MLHVSATIQDLEQKISDPAVAFLHLHQSLSTDTIPNGGGNGDGTSYFPLFAEPTLLQLDMNDFVLTLEHEYYQPGQDQQQTAKTNNLHQRQHEHIQTTKKKKLSTTLEQTELHIRPKRMHAKQHLSKNSSPNSPPSNSSTSTEDVPISAACMNSSTTTETKLKSKKIQKRRNYQRVFHTIPARNSCSEKKTGMWKFHLMDADEAQKDESAYKFHFYSGNIK